MERDRDSKRRENLERLEEKGNLDREGHEQGNLPDQDIYQDAIADRGQEISDKIRGNETSED